MFKEKYYYIIIGVLVLCLFGALGFKGMAVPKNPNASEKMAFVIEKGEGLERIASNLANQGLIPSKFWFQSLALISGDYKNLIAGRYTLSPAMSPFDILAKIKNGQVFKEKLVIKEGWTLKDIARAFENKGLSTQREFLEMAGFLGVDDRDNNNGLEPVDFSEEFEFLKQKPKNASLEGFLFPDTYYFTADIKQDIRKMLANFASHVPKQMRDYKVLIMASILEKEVRGIKDKEIASGILWKRMRNGWPLQVDATLTYITHKDSLSLTKQDLAIDSPYNTYKYKGLPPTPISNPGIESIEAAVNYKESPYWFYLTTPEGKAIFSRTLREHAINKAKYLE